MALAFSDVLGIPAFAGMSSWPRATQMGASGAFATGRVDSDLWRGMPETPL